MVGVKPGSAFARLDGSTFQVRPDSREDHAALLRDLAAAGQAPAQIVHLWTVGPEASLADGETGAAYFHPLAALGQALIDEEPSGAMDLVVVTSGAERGRARAASPLKR